MDFVRFWREVSLFGCYCIAAAPVAMYAQQFRPDGLGSWSAVQAIREMLDAKPSA